jgi:hypothetical protein
MELGADGVQIPQLLNQSSTNGFCHEIGVFKQGVWLYCRTNGKVLAQRKFTRAN